MRQNVYIQKDLILKHIELADLDLEDLPQFPIIEKRSRPRLLGVVKECRPNGYAFVLTNGFGIKDSVLSCQPVLLFLHISQWKDSEPYRENMWITFELKKESEHERDAAINAKPLKSTLEDYLICKNYLGEYGEIIGKLNGISYSLSIQTEIYNRFFSSEEGRRLALNRIYLRKSADYYEWKHLLSSMTEKERDSFVLDTSIIELTVGLRICFYECLDSIEWIKHPSVVSAFISQKDSDKTVFDLLSESFKTEEDKLDWIEYAKNSEACCDGLFVELFFLTFNPDIYNSIGDKKSITRALYKDDKRTLEYLRFCMKEERFGELGVIIDSISTWKLVDAIKQMNDDERILFLCGLPEKKTIELVSNKLLEDCNLKSRLMSSEKGRQIILTDLYERETSDTSEWNDYLSLLDEEGQKSFVFDTGRITPTAELRVCLYKYTHLVEWLKHPSVVSLIGNKDNDSEVSVKQFMGGFQNEDDKNEWLNYIKDCPITTDDLKAELFYLTENLDIFNAIERKSIVINHMNEAGVYEVKLFLKFCYRNLRDEEFKSIIEALTEDRLVGALKAMDSDDSIQFVNRLPEDKALGIVTKEGFRDSELFVTYIGEKWDSLKGEMPYCVFDLESDGENIKEFAVFAEDNMRPYTGEDQLSVLFKKLSEFPIIVGHNIKLWDLPILYQKGLKIPEGTFIWDTLEMEILLNPCRYAYSLHAEHNAEADTNLTNELFWNQLYRLSTDNQLVEQLKEVLPNNIGKIIDKLRVDYFSEYLKSTAKLESQFFQELRPLDDELVERLKGIALIPESEETLLIAPSNLWARLAQYIPLSFPGALADDSFRSIDIKTLKRNPLEDIVKQTILERFCEVSRTPVLENMAQYLRVVGDDARKISFTEEELQDYLCRFQSHIDCIDVSSFEDTHVLSKNYKHIYIIGTELEDRVHTSKACEDKTFADLIALGSRLPYIMAATNYAPVKGDEIEKLGIIQPQHAANIWVERERNGKFVFYMNYQYQAYREKFLAHFSTKRISIEWKFKGGEYGHINLTQVSRNRTAEMVMRVNSSTTQRSKYWLFQIALLNKIHQANPELPIVYVINDKKEIEELTRYATSLGFFIPTVGNGFRKLEYIGSHPNGMVIISKQEFIDEVGAYRTDKPFCYVWDNMDIDRYMLMWDKLPFDDDYKENADDERDDKLHHTTPRQCIHAAWPIYEHYCSLVMDNSKDTQFYIIDPHFDDYEGIADSCKANSFKVDLWGNDDDYKKALEDSSQYFDDSRGKEENIDVSKALNLIRIHWGYTDWKPTQKEVLPHIWEKRGDCIVSMPTGEGKSVCFQGPALYKSSITKKLSLVITPLRALMQDQVEELQKKGFATNVDYLSSDRQRPEVENIYRKLRSGEIALLYITPERFRVKSFMNVLYQRMEMDGGLEYIIFDEAHCISQWGQEFRPDYRNAVLTCIEMRKRFDFMFALFSATVTSQVESDIRTFLPDIQRMGQMAEDYNPIRQHIGISFALTEHEDSARIDEIVRFIEDNKIDFSLSCMIIFCRTHRQCEETADTLSELALKASPDSVLHKCVDKIGFYHAGLDADLRNDVYEQFKRKKDVEPLYILCATKAFGMGMDIPNVHYVVHYNPPSVLEDYLQEVGRAGRDEKQYREAFDNGKEQIPALCLTSQDDFRKLKELLVKSQMSWSNLTQAKDKIVEYITRFQTLEQTKTKPIVVPFSVWAKNTEDFNDSTTSRLAFHWLEHIGCIKQGYLSQASLDITLIEADTFNTTLKHNPVYLYLVGKAKENGNRFPVSIKELRDGLRKEKKPSLPWIMNQIVLCMEKGLLELNETMNCKIVPRRYCEANYMIRHNVNSFALHIVFEGIRDLLSDCKKDVYRAIGQNEREYIYKQLMDKAVYDNLIEENGIMYMPWKAEEENAPKMAVTRYETFKKNIQTRMGPQIFNILNYLPMVSYKIEKQDDDTICLIKIKDKKWQAYLEDLESDCLKLIKLTAEQTSEFNWANVMIQNGWVKKGYSYFEDLLSVLHHLAYVEHTPLVKSGIEVLVTEITQDDIPEGLTEDSSMYAFRKEFDDNERIKKVRLACMDIFSHVDKEHQGIFIQRYFQSNSYDDYLALAGDFVPEDSDIMSELAEEALKLEEEKLYGNVEKGILRNEEQIRIYEQPTSVDVNVLAGPGAGKTHVLTLRCARLIYKEHVDPSHLLVLAYNRAVVVELRNRLNSLFTKLGMSRLAHQLNVYTFAALAKKCMGRGLDNIPTELWEYAFFDYLSKHVRDFMVRFPCVEYILVDEFQDMTKARLDSLLRIHAIYPDAKLFTIGDINQSIYGFDRVPKDPYGRKKTLQPEEYANVLDPRPYYQRIDEEIHPQQLKMFTNYRSFQKILDKASEFIPKGEKMPVSAPSIMKYEPKETYVEEYDNVKDKGRIWYKDIASIVNWAKEQNIEADKIQDNEEKKRIRHIDTIAVFFRTNNEVYRGYSRIKAILSDDVRIRIQGESLGELWREREIYYLIDTLNRYADQPIDLHNNKTANGIKEFLKKKMQASPLWDAYTIDVAYTLVLNYMDSIRSDYATHTWKDLADYIKDIASRDDAGQVYKIYDNYRSSRIMQESPLTVVLTTMHKVKGLEFDVVVTTPSFANMPLRPHREYKEGEKPLVDDLADMDEERRLMFVAYSRAKKRLIIYKGEREHALQQSSIYLALDIKELRYTEPDPGMDKYYLSYTAQDGIFDKVDSYILNSVKKDDPVEIKVGDAYGNYYIIHNGHYIGRLSSKSNIMKRAKEDGVAALKDFFVSNVYVWTYEDTLASDEANTTDFALKWSAKAKEQGFINIVQIAGFGTPIQ
jgi:ATP-dependent DNA helicase RecQ